MAQFRSPHNSRFFHLCLFICLSIICLPVFAVDGPDSDQFAPEILSQAQRCRSVRNIAISKQCAYIRHYCADEDDGILSYFSLYYCKLEMAQPFALVIMLVWLAYLFSGLGIVAGVYLAVNLSAVAQDLHISDTLAGVTLLALGNGAPDIFSTIAAMNQSSHNLAIGELVGAAAFITSVIPGSMALIRSFDVVKVSLIRDAVFLLGTIAFLLLVLYDGYLRLWHCAVLFVIYIIYITVVTGWHWWQSRQADNSEHEALEPTDNSRPPRSVHETDRLLPNHLTNQINGNIRDVTQRPCQRSAADIRLVNEEMLCELPGEVTDYTHLSGKALNNLHRRHWAQNRATRNKNNRHDRGRDENVDHGLAAMSTADQDHRTTTATKLSISKSSHTILRTFRLMIWADDGEEKAGILLTAAHIVMLPLNIILKTTIPRVQEDDGSQGETHDSDITTKDDDHGKTSSDLQSRSMILIQCFTVPQFMLWFAARQLSKTASEMFLPSMISLAISTALAALVYLTSVYASRYRWYRFLCVPGFIMSIGWISIIADEIVAVLKVLGIISGIPDGIMGITIFAIGNSIDDWAADLSVARHEHPVMALGACFGGPLLNILLGLSISGASVLIKGGKANQSTGIDLKPSRSLFFVMGATILNIVLLLALMIWTRWKMTRLVGFALTSVWVICTVLNVILEVTSPR